MSSIAGLRLSSDAEITLERRLLRAHAQADSAALAGLYAEAADLAESLGNRDRACFYLTHAFIFALEAGSAEAVAYEARLSAYGRI